MAAFNWIDIETRCPVCGNNSLLRCQTHVASDYAGDASGRFHGREYRLGQTMAWWPRTDKRFDSWRAQRRRVGHVEPEVDEEACYATCKLCNAPLYVIVRFWA